MSTYSFIVIDLCSFTRSWKQQARGIILSYSYHTRNEKMLFNKYSDIRFRFRPDSSFDTRCYPVPAGFWKLLSGTSLVMIIWIRILCTLQQEAASRTPRSILNEQHRNAVRREVKLHWQRLRAHLNEPIHGGVSRPVRDQELHVLVLDLRRFRLSDLHCVGRRRRHCRFGDQQSVVEQSLYISDDGSGGDNPRRTRRQNDPEALGEKLSGRCNSGRRKIHSTEAVEQYLFWDDAHRYGHQHFTDTHEEIRHLHVIRMSGATTQVKRRREIVQPDRAETKTADGRLIQRTALRASNGMSLCNLRRAALDVLCSAVVTAQREHGHSPKAGRTRHLHRPHTVLSTVQQSTASSTSKSFSSFKKNLNRFLLDSHFVCDNESTDNVEHSSNCSYHITALNKLS